jgi:hypothetical protein
MLHVDFLVAKLIDSHRLPAAPSFIESGNLADTGNDKNEDESFSF